LARQGYLHLIKAIPICGFDEGLNKISDHLKFSDCRCHQQFALFGFNRENQRSTVWNKRYLWICALFHLFREETNAGLQGTAIYFDLKDSLYINTGVFSPGCTLQRFCFLSGARKQVERRLMIRNNSRRALLIHGINKQAINNFSGI